MTTRSERLATSAAEVLAARATSRSNYAAGTIESAEYERDYARQRFEWLAIFDATATLPITAATYSVGQTVTLLDTHPGDGGWSSAYVESVHGTTYGVRVQGHSLYYVTADKLDKYRGRY